MAEYIEREAAVEALDVAERFLRRILAAEVAPVVHGEWIPFHSEAAGDIQYCSACDVGYPHRTDFCPHCGAKMDGERKGDD